MRKLLLLAVAVAALSTTACEPFTLSLTVDRRAVADSERISSNHRSNLVQLTGWVRCTSSETVTFSPQITETDSGAGTERRFTGSEVSLPCDGEDRRWSAITQFFIPGDLVPFPRPTSGSISSSVTVPACTTTSSSGGSDCVTITRTLDVVSGDLPR